MSHCSPVSLCIPDPSQMIITRGNEFQLLSLGLTQVPGNVHCLSLIFLNQSMVKKNVNIKKLCDTVTGFTPKPLPSTSAFHNRMRFRAI